MFTEKKEKSNLDPGMGQNRINEGTKLVGDITSKGFFRIDGTIEGNVNTPSKVVIGTTGVINGTLICENADVEGRIEGNVDVSETLSLKSTAFIEGEVVAGKLAVEPGATFNATCTMKGSKRNDPLRKEDPLEKENKKPQNHPFDRPQRTQKTKTEQERSN